MYLALGDKLTHAQGPQAPLHTYKRAQNLWPLWILASLIIEPKSLVGPTNRPGHIQTTYQLNLHVGWGGGAHGIPAIRFYSFGF
jgi:hypothetical protein